MKYSDEVKESLYNACIRQWGFDLQATMAMEEAAEFIKAMSKYQRQRHMIATKELAEEITDLRLMLNQIESGLKLHKLCADYETQKLDRLTERLKAK